MKNLLKKGSEKLGIPLSGEQIEKFLLFHDELKKWGRKINLTALLNDEKKLVEELYLDSLAPLLIIGQSTEGNLFDIGSGAGFPGIPLKISSSTLQITLTDTIEKKVLFMRHAVRSLSFSGIDVIKTRFGNEGSHDLSEDSFQWAVSKAVTDVLTLGIWAYPHLKKGGKLICMKGPGEETVSIDGYGEPAVHYYTLPYSGVKRYLYVYSKS